MKIYVDKKPESCGVCTLVNVSVLDVMENREMVLQHFCPIMDLSVNPDNLDANCPLTELKPEELKWEDLESYGISRDLKNKYNIETSMPYNDPEWKVYNIYIDGNLKTTRDTLNDAKQYCQEDNNRLFCEMIGGIK